MKFFLAAAFLISACASLPGGAGSMGLRAEPNQYSPAMSSTPGIGFTTLYTPPAGTSVNYHWTTDFGYFTADAITALDVHDHHRERIDDAWQDVTEAFVR